MRPARSFLWYTGGVLVGGALLAPWLYALAQLGATRMPALGALAHQPFHRYVHRSWLILAIVGLCPLLRSLGLRSSRELGLAPPSPRRCRNWLIGFAIGLGSLAALAILAVVCGSRQFAGDLTAPLALHHIAGALLTALGVSVLEEILFRGVLFGGLRKSCAWPIALGISSAVYAWVHFFQSPAWTGPVEWSSGLALLPQMMRGLADARALVPGLFNLTLVGVLLGLAYQQTGNLYFSFGLHAGWIFWLKSYGFLTQPVGNPAAWFWGTNRLTDGWLTLIILGLVWVWMMRRPRCNDTANGT